MSPFIAAGALIVGVVVIAGFFGAICGPIFWKVRAGFLFGAFSAVVMYFLLVALLDSNGLKASAYFGVFPLLLTFLTGNLTARFLSRRRDDRPIWIGLVGFGIALIVGFGYVNLFGAIMGFSSR